MAIQAKIVTRMVKIAAVEAAKNKVVVVMINQVRANLGYGADTTTSGGFALKHCTTHKLKMKRTGTTPYSMVRDGEKIVVGHELAIEVERNKVAPPKRVAVINLFNQSSEKFGPRGVDRAKEAFVLGKRRDVGAIKQGGAYYTLPDGEKYQGEENALEALRANPDLVDKIRDQAIAVLSGEVIPDVEIEVPDDDETEETPVSKAPRKVSSDKAKPNFKKGT